MKISVIVPIYNTEKYLHKCIDSILNQTFKDFELILVDDGSTDSSGTICDEYAEKDCRIKVIHKQNSGVSEARNEGIETSSGEVIVFVDSDDTIQNSFLDQVNENMDKSALFVCGQRLNYIHQDEILRCEETKVDVSRIYSVQEVCKKAGVDVPFPFLHSPCAKAYKSAVIKENKLRFDKNISLGEDLLFNLLYFEYINDLYIDENVYYEYYKRGEDSLTTKYSADIYEKISKIYEEYRKKTKKENWLDGIENIYVNSLISCIFHYYEHKRNKQEKKNIIKKVLNAPHIYKLKVATKGFKFWLVRYLATHRKKRLIKLIFDIKFKR